MTRTIKTFFYSFLLILFFSSCENKWPKNGNLDGFWQLMNITKDGVTTDVNQQTYWSIRTNLVQFNVLSGGKYFCHFSREGDNLVLTDFCQEAINQDKETSIDPWISDSLSTQLNVFGIYPSKDLQHSERVTQTFRFITLTYDTMVLESQGYTLNFRKF